MNTTKEHIERARQKHHDALLALASLTSGLSLTVSGLSLWRKLRRLEAEATAITTALCNGAINQELAELQFEQIEAKVAKVFGKLPAGFFINRDPRGYALKLEPGSAPFPLHEDWGRYQILAPTID